RHLAGQRRLRHCQRAAGPEPSRLPPLPSPPRGGASLRSPPPRRLWRTTRTLCHRGCTAKICRYGPGHGTSWEEGLGTLAPAVSEVPPPNMRRVGGGSDPAFLYIVDRAIQKGINA